MFFRDRALFMADTVHTNHINPDHRSYKLLGIHLDELLTFDYHIKHLCSKLNKSLYCINRTKNFLSSKALKTLYYSLVHSHLSYCTPILGCASNTNLQQLFKVQKKAIRIISKNAYGAHTDPIFLDLKILPFPKLVTYTQMKLMHSIVYNHCPPSLRNIFSRNEQREISQNLRNDEEYTVPHPRIELFKKCLLINRTQVPAQQNNIRNWP
jgi:hypothetical protein